VRVEQKKSVAARYVAGGDVSQQRVSRGITRIAGLASLAATRLAAGPPVLLPTPVIPNAAMWRRHSSSVR
jgi:hypothetical protein